MKAATEAGGTAQEIFKLVRERVSKLAEQVRPVVEAFLSKAKQKSTEKDQTPEAPVAPVKKRTRKPKTAPATQTAAAQQS